MITRNLDATSKDIFRIGLFETIRIGKLRSDFFARVEDLRRFKQRDLYQVSPAWLVASDEVEYATPFAQHLHALLVIESGGYYILDEGALLILV